MQRHNLTLQLGSQDKSPTAGVPHGYQPTVVDLRPKKATLEFGIGRFLRSLTKLGIRPSEAGVDFLLVATAVQFADTRINREATAQDGWTREIHISVPVSDPALWNTAVSDLQTLLQFLSGDLWAIEFRPRPSGLNQLAKPPHIERTYDSACLFSGGLDSLCGAADLLTDGRTPLFVGQAGETLTAHYQNGLARKLRRAFGKKAAPFAQGQVIAPAELVPSVGNEDTSRARSFLFFALGVCALSGSAEKRTLYVPENGLIALNGPLDPLRLGSHTTRTTHPHLIHGLNGVLDDLGIPVELYNPFITKTKGELVADARPRDFVRATYPKTISCSSPAKYRWKGYSPTHCGHCVPCIIRQASINAAFGADKTDYIVPLSGQTDVDSANSIGKHIHSFKIAHERLRRSPRAALRDIAKQGSLTGAGVSLSALSDTYRRGLLEVDAVLHHIRVSH